ncbi:MAG: Ig-like domain-containing protein, partial [Treponema sp.]|nr:Ig-like domain-containing protein [Treponema sp.]
MKKNGIIWGMLALGLVLGLMVTGCDDGLGGGTSTGDGATVTSVTVSPSPASVAKGANQTFSATVQGTNSPAQTVNWTVSGGGTGTSITTGGVLTVATSESATSLTVEATSTVDTAKSGTAAVTVTSSSGGGTLTVLNYPSSAYVFICTENDPPSSVTELAGRL